MIDDDPTLETRPRGRPRAEEPGSSVTVWLPQGAHDSLIELAKQQEKSISATVRDLLRLNFPTK